MVCFFLRYHYYSSCRTAQENPKYGFSRRNEKKCVWGRERDLDWEEWSMKNTTHYLTYLHNRSEALSELYGRVSPQILRWALTSPQIFAVTVGIGRAMPLAAQGLDHVWDKRDAEHSKEGAASCFWGLSSCLPYMLSYISLFWVLLGFTDSMFLGECTRSEDMSMSSHSISEKWNSFDLGNRKLKGIREK